MSWLEWVGVAALVVVGYRSVVYFADRYPLIAERLVMAHADRQRRKRERRDG